MANYVVVPSEVDPALNRAIPQNTNTLQSADDLPDPLDSDDKPQFIVGFSTGRSSVTHELLINIVLRFTTATAADAANDTAAVYGRTASGPRTGKVSIPAHPITMAFASTTDEDTELHSVTAHGPYVLFQYARSKRGLDSATALVSKTLDLQEPLIDRFVPDNPARFVDLPVDDTGLLSRTLPITSRDADLPAAWVSQPRAALHFEENPAVTAPLFTKAAVEAVSAGKSRVYEAADTLGAGQVADQLAAQRLRDGYRPAAAVAGLSAAL